MFSFKEWLLLSEQSNFISLGEYIDRLKTHGFKIIKGPPHYMIASPNDVGLLTISRNNWFKNWHYQIKDLRKIGHPDLARRIFTNDWESPEQPKEASPVIKRIRLTYPEQIENKEIKIGKEWKKIDTVAFGTGGIDVLFSDGEFKTFSSGEEIEIK